MIRDRYLKQIDLDFQVQPIVILLGPRQSGKTTLARQYAKSQPQAIHYFDLEDPADLAALADPKLTLSSLAGLIIIDEVQRLPELFPILRVLVDQNREKQQFLILGSASRTLIFQTSETLAGRVAYLEVHPFSYHEIDNPQRHWIHGGYPLSYLTENSQASESWRENYIRTYLEMDLPMLGIRVSSENIRRFWMMLAHYHGNIVNYSELGRSLQVSHVTVKHYLDILVGAFMVRQI
jgi:predicted AAA+ superfamily ATPase